MNHSWNNKNFTNANRGLYLETLINQTIDYYIQNGIAYFEKRNLPTNIVKHYSDNKFVCSIKSKTTFDYFGYYNYCYYEIEAKQTDKDFFDLNLIKKHQLEHYHTLAKFNIKSYLIIYFDYYDSFLLIDFKKLHFITEGFKKKKIDYNLLKKNSQSLEISFPGIIDFVKLI